METQKDNWYAGLQNNFDNEAEAVPQEIWGAVEKQIPQKKSYRKLFFILFSVASISFIFALLFFKTEARMANNDFTGIQFKLQKQSLNNKKISKTATSKIVFKKSESEIIKGKFFNESTLPHEKLINPSINDQDKEINTNSNDYRSENNSILQNVKPEVSKVDTTKRFSNLTFLKPTILLLELGQLIKAHNNKSNDYYLTIYGGLGLNKRIIQGDLDAENKKSRDFGEITFLAETKQVGIDFQKRLNSFLSVGTGFMWYKSTYSSNWFFRQMYLAPAESSIYLNSPEGRINITDENFLDNFSIGDTLLYKLKSSFTTSSFSIPVFVAVDKRFGKFSPFLKAGLSFDIQNKVEASVQTFEYGQMSHLSSSLEKNRIQASMGGMMSCGVNYSLTKHISVSLEERINLAITPIVNYDGLSLKTRGFYTNFGISYLISQPKK